MSIKKNFFGVFFSLNLKERKCFGRFQQKRSSFIVHIDEKGAWKYKENKVCGGVMRKKVGHIGAMGLKLAKGGLKWSAVDT